LKKSEVISIFNTRKICRHWGSRRWWWAVWWKDDQAYRWFCGDAC
jgi:hypothetical protein